jgi:hypothetical protein
MNMPNTFGLSPTAKAYTCLATKGSNYLKLRFRFLAKGNELTKARASRLAYSYTNALSPRSIAGNSSFSAQ